MAVETNVSEDNHVFLGEDKVLEFTVVDEDSIPIDVTGWAMIWDLRKADKTSGDALIEKTTTAGGITITGTYSAVVASNTQRVRVTLADTDSDSSTTLQAKTYRHALKRADAGSETVLAFGDFVFLQATTR